MFYLLVIMGNNQPAVIQGSLDEINSRLMQMFKDGDIDREDWDFYSNFALMEMGEGNRLTLVKGWECLPIPQFFKD
jgi:hypothetical protein